MANREHAAETITEPLPAVPTQAGTTTRYRLRSDTSASSTVAAMKQAEAPNTQCGSA